MTPHPPLRVTSEPLSDEQGHALLSQPPVLYWLAEAVRDLYAAQEAPESSDRATANVAVA